MRLHYLSYQRLPTSRAHGYQIAKMCTAFAQAGAEVTLVHPRYHEIPDGPPEALGQFYGVPAGTFAQHPVPSFASRWRLSHASTPVFWATVLSTGRQHNRYLSAHAREGDIVFTRDFRNLRKLARLRDQLGFRLVVELHNLPQRGAAARAAELAAADLTVPISAALKAAWVAQGMPAERALVEHDAFDTAEFAAAPTRAEARRELGLPQEQFIIGFLGTFSFVAGDKGTGALIDAFARLKDLPTASLHLVGSRDPAQEAAPLQERAAALGIPAERLGIHGRVDRAGVIRWLAAFDVCANALPDTAHSRRASPLKVFEYMAAERPIVVTNLDGTAEVLTDEQNALLVPPGDITALAGALRRLHDDPELARRLATQARQDVEQYTWDQRVARILARVAEL
ncbi:MAG: glycosyltransferase [Armatimonadetes bacterium]|nr:glycosyltransferase [Armatimonadota bacterium]